MNYSDKQHRYNTIDNYLKATFNSKVFKVALNGNFSCPNRDGTISNKGCIFCSEKGSGDFAGDPNDNLEKQFYEVTNIIHHKWPNAYYIAYFQAFTNTYGPIEKLKRIYNQAINLHPNVVILDIATRPDCLNEETLDYLESLNKIKPLWVELGLQTIHQQTADYINRGYTLDVFTNAVNELRKRNISVIVHIINGLPNETKSMMLENILFLNNLDIQGIKIHTLLVMKGTILGNIYLNNPFKIMDLDEYSDLVSEQLALLRDDIIVHRVSGDAPRELLIAPLWSTKKLVVMNEIDKLMKLKNYYQGCKKC